MSLDSVLSGVLVAAILGIAAFLLWYRNRYFNESTTRDLWNRATPMIAAPWWEEKRQHPRVAVSWDASLDTAQGTVNAKLRDVSYGGAFVFLQAPLPTKEGLRIAIEVPNEAPLPPLNAEVVWSNANVPEHLILNRGMAIRFINNSEENLQRLNAAIDSLFHASAKELGAAE